MTKAQILLEPCTQCGAPIGERCRPVTIADMTTTLERILDGLEVGAPVELEDVLVVRRILQEALPDFQVEAYHDYKSVRVGVGLSGVILARRTLGAV